MGIDWWRHDPMLNGTEQTLAEENRQLRARVESLESASPDKSSGRGRKS
jgi:hypothetical protein